MPAGLGGYTHGYIAGGDCARGPVAYHDPRVALQPVLHLGAIGNRGRGREQSDQNIRNSLVYSEKCSGFAF
jgi:hypothetical protein